jgi:ABC-type transport system substrate-binding protein
MPPLKVDPDVNLIQGVAMAYDVNDALDTYLLHLDPDAVFHDGSPVTAADVKKAWEVGAWPENQISWGASLIYMRAIQGIDAVEAGDATEASGLVAVDDHTLEIRLKAPSATYPMQMALWLFGIFKPDFDDEDWMLHPNGVGPFAATLDPDTGYIELNAAETWWREKPALQKVEMTYVGDTQTQLVMWENGEVDAIYADQIRQPSLHTDPNNPLREHFAWIKGVGWHAAAFDQSQKPFEDPKVRAAMAHAVDMEPAIKAVFGPAAERAVGLIPRTMPCYRGISTGYEYDPAKAKKLLAESTYGSAENLPPIMMADTREPFLRFYQLLQEQWKDNLGIEVTVTQLERGQASPEGRNLPTNNHTWGLNDPSQPLSDEGHSESTIVVGTTNHKNAEADAMIDAANLLSLDNPGRCKAYQDAEDIILDNYYYLPYKQNNDVRAFLVQPWVVGFVAATQDEINTLNTLKIGKRTK